MIKGHPVKISEITTSKTGKHGHAKAHIVAIDIFTAKKYEDLCPCSHNMSIPFVKRLELQALTADAATGEISLLLESGETKDDIFLPSIQVPGGSAPTEEDEKVAKEIVDMVELGEKAGGKVMEAGLCKSDHSLLSVFAHGLSKSRIP